MPAQTSPSNVDDFYSILTKNANHNTGHMMIAVTKDDVTNTYAVTVSIDGDVTCQESGISMTIGIPHLQTHWGSGVVFQNVQYVARPTP